MTVTAVRKDPQNLSMTLEAEFDASAERVWQLWADPRQLERFWEPPIWPATFTRHDMKVGGRGEYCLTGPKGEKWSGSSKILPNGNAKLRERRLTAQKPAGRRQEEELMLGPGRARLLRRVHRWPIG